jgi:hypothetical protein
MPPVVVPVMQAVHDIAAELSALPAARRHAAIRSRVDHAPAADPKFESTIPS